MEQKSKRWFLKYNKYAGGGEKSSRHFCWKDLGFLANSYLERRKKTLKINKSNQCYEQNANKCGGGCQNIRSILQYNCENVWKGRKKMIVTVTMNPAIDKTVEVGQFVYRGLNRIRKVEYDAGGKGINVSKTIHELGGTSVATGFLGGNNGRVIASVLKEKGIACDFIWVDGETRTNAKVVEEDGSLTELNEPGALIREENISQLKQKLLGYANPNTLFIFSGSIPAGVPKEIYGELISLVKAKGASTLLDADGEGFCKSVEAIPDYIKPNQVELEGYLKLHKDASVVELVKAAEGIKAKGIKNIVVSMGKDGALFLLEGYKAKCPGLSVKAHSTVGAGDAMVAALAYAWDRQLGKEETVKLCMAVSAGAVTTVGTKPPSKEVVDNLIKQVKIERIGD